MSTFQIGLIMLLILGLGMLGVGLVVGLANAGDCEHIISVAEWICDTSGNCHWTWKSICQ